MAINTGLIHWKGVIYGEFQFLRDVLFGLAWMMFLYQALPTYLFLNLLIYTKAYPLSWLNVVGIALYIMIGHYAVNSCFENHTVIPNMRAALVSAFSLALLNTEALPSRSELGDITFWNIRAAIIINGCCLLRGLVFSFFNHANLSSRFHHYITRPLALTLVSVLEGSVIWLAVGKVLPGILILSVVWTFILYVLMSFTFRSATNRIVIG